MGKDGDSTDGKKKRFTSAAQLTREAPGKYTPSYEQIVEAPQRIVMASAALPKRGKTTFGFSMPKPLAYLQLDNNYEHALAKARKEYGKDSIRHLSYFADPRADLKAANMAVWERFIRDFEYCVLNFKSVLVDTSTELLDVRKLAEYGRTTQIPQIYYGSFYADFRWMVKHATDHDANVNFVHRLGDEWKNGDRTGDYVLQGWKGVQFDAQVYVEHQRDAEGGFTTNIIECAQDAMLMGLTLAGTDDENDFPTLATRIFTDTDKSDWE